MTDTLERRWRELLARGEPESREVDAESPLRMLVGLSSSARPYFAVITERRPGLPELTSAIEVTRRQRRADGRWTLTLELQVPSLTDAFISLVSELAEKSSAARTEADALHAFLETLAEWQELLTARADRLSEAALRGLIAELWFGFVSDAHSHAAGETVWAWTGPFQAPQDYRFLSPGLTYEVKALRPGRTRVEISSEEQLDGPHILLAVVTLEQVSADAEGLTLPALLADIRNELADGADRTEFNQRFARLHVDPADDWYADQRFVARRLQLVDVRDGFPAIRRSQLPPALSGVNYLLDLEHVSEHVISDVLLGESEGG